MAQSREERVEALMHMKQEMLTADNMLLHLDQAGLEAGKPATQFNGQQRKM